MRTHADWYHAVMESFLEILNDHLNKSIDAGLGALEALVAGSSKEAFNLLLEVRVIHIEDDNGTEISQEMGVGGDVASVRLVVPNNIRTSISSLATSLTPITEKVVESTLGLLEEVLQRAAPIVDLMKQHEGAFNGNFEAQYSYEHFLAGLLERFFKGFLGLMAGLSLGKEAYFSSNIFHFICTEYKASGALEVAGVDEVDAGITSLVCSSALKVLTAKVAPQVVALVEKRGYVVGSIGEHLMTKIQIISESLSHTSTLRDELRRGNGEQLEP